MGQAAALARIFGECREVFDLIASQSFAVRMLQRPLRRDNKVKFNIKNVHFAKKNEDGAYDAPIKLPGAVSISLEAQGELEP